MKLKKLVLSTGKCAQWMKSLRCALLTALCSVSMVSTGYINTSLPVQQGLMQNGYKSTCPGEKQIALLIYTLHRMNGSIPGDLMFLIADQWAPLSPQLSINQLVTGRDSRNGVFSRKCERMVHRKISECNENDTECITFVPSDTVYLFLLQRSNVRPMSPFLEIRRKYWYRYGPVVRRSAKLAVLAESERVYFMMTKTMGRIMFRKRVAGESVSDRVTVEDTRRTDHDLVYKAEVSWRVHGYSVRDISIFQLNESRPLPAHITWATLSVAGARAEIANLIKAQSI